MMGCGCNRSLSQAAPSLSQNGLSQNGYGLM
eukprot:CAMPEP_0185902832 /NCGR_PEP_ID=MMETSP0196C-20130402/2043_1 /TAXON_ID=2932 /ORGANISM="Alexandrium fundyense, Strain CCMP1719" /LENGTH=30 /DNA_ID= /DNA_START= /DNA_END= /DNA_ORIENTATION=